MLYEKKTLILSGEGTGVVLMEKSARGVMFTLRIFNMPECGALRAGIITPREVYVREIARPDIATAFVIEGAETCAIHFAVFDDRLRLYGACGCKKMWEANVMELLTAHERRVSTPAPPLPAALPPVIERPATLPLPDGTGLPQSRLSVFGDDALAEDDFYTGLDLSSRMREVDGFLDGPRALDDLAPRMIPHAAAEPVTKNIEPLHPLVPSVLCEVAAVRTGPLPWELEAAWIRGRYGGEVKVRELTVPAANSGEQVKHVRHADRAELVSGDVDKLFTYCRRDEKLSALLPELEWVKVHAEGFDISVGRAPGVLCYAVAGTYQKRSPLGEDSRWLPEKPDRPQGKGYWIVE